MFGGGYIKGFMTGGVVGAMVGLMIASRSGNSQKQMDMNNLEQGAYQYPSEKVPGQYRRVE